MSRTNLVLKLLCSLALIYFTIFSIKWVPKITQGYASYYTFSRMLITGEDLSKGYSDEYFSGKIKEYRIDVYDILAGNLPTTSFALTAFAWLDPSSARIAWSVFSIAAFLFSLYIIFTVFEISISNTPGLLILLITILWRPAYENIAFGQMYAVLLLLFSISLLGLRKEKNLLFTFALSSVFLVKGYGVVNLIWLAVKRKWKDLSYAIGFILAVVIISALLVGLSTWQVYLSAVTNKMGQMPEMGHTAYQTINSFLLHLFVYDSTWLLHPLVLLPDSLVFILSICVSLLFIAYILIEKSLHNDLLPLSFSAAIAVGVVTAPVAEEYHYLLFLPLVIGMAKILLTAFNGKRKFSMMEFFFIASVLIMIIPINYKALQFTTAPLYLLAYPKLYAGIILLIIYKRMIRLQNNQKESAC